MNLGRSWKGKLLELGNFGREWKGWRETAGWSNELKTRYDCILI